MSYIYIYIYIYIYMEHLFLMFLDHTQRRITVGRIPLDEWSARRRDFYLTTHDTHNRQTSMPPVGFEPTISAGERPQTYALNRAVTGTGSVVWLPELFWTWKRKEKSRFPHRELNVFGRLESGTFGMKWRWCVTGLGLLSGKLVLVRLQAATRNVLKQVCIEKTKHPFECNTMDWLKPRSRVLPEKRTVPQLVKKFPAIYGTRVFITAFKSAQHLSLSWTKSVQSQDSFKYPPIYA